MKGVTKMACRPVILLNNQCNFKCYHCYVSENCKEIPIQKVIEFYNNVIKPNNSTSLRFAGGEPFLYSKMSELADFFSNVENIKINFTTNGSIINDSLITNLKRMHINLLKVSVLSLRPSVYRSIIGVDFPLEKTLENVLEFAKHFDVGINMTITRDNIQDVNSLIDFCVNNGIKRFFISQLTLSGGGIKIADKKLSQKEMAEVANIVKSVDKNVLDIKYDDCTHCAFNEDFVMNWDGDIFPCCALTSSPEFKIGTSEMDISVMHEKIKKMNKNRTKLCFVEEFIYDKRR